MVHYVPLYLISPVLRLQNVFPKITYGPVVDDPIVSMSSLHRAKRPGKGPPGPLSIALRPQGEPELWGAARWAPVTPRDCNDRLSCEALQMMKAGGYV